jgi:hypothetical protein
MAGIEDAQHVVVIEDLVQAAAVVAMRVRKAIKRGFIDLTPWPA